MWRLGLCAAAGIAFGVASPSSALTEIQRLTPVDAASGDLYGFSVAMDSTWVCVGDPSRGDDPHQWGRGRAHVRSLVGAADELYFYGGRSTALAWSVGIHDDYFFIGSPSDDSTVANVGAVRIYTDAGELLTSAQPTDLASARGFGTSLCFGSDLMVVGAPYGHHGGSAYLMTLPRGIEPGGVELARLEPTGLDSDADFGAAVAYFGDRAVVGAPRDHGDGFRNGAAFLYDTTSWELIAKLEASDGDQNDVFGTSVALSSGFVYVGAVNADQHGTGSGAVYVFDAGTGEFVRMLEPHDPAAALGFGAAIAVDNDSGRVLVGANGSEEAYLFFDQSGREIGVLTASDGTAGSGFGTSVALGSGRAVVGAPDQLNEDGTTGAAYLFDADFALLGDLTNDGCVNSADLGVLLAAWGTGSADLNADGITDASDLAILLAAWRGC